VSSTHILFIALWYIKYGDKTKEDTIPLQQPKRRVRNLCISFLRSTIKPSISLAKNSKLILSRLPKDNKFWYTLHNIHIHKCRYHNYISHMPWQVNAEARSTNLIATGVEIRGSPVVRDHHFQGQDNHVFTDGSPSDDTKCSPNIVRLEAAPVSICEDDLVLPVTMKFQSNLTRGEGAV
jgi:hypothetical protein